LAWDDPVVWILIVAVVVFLFGSSKIPSIARALGEARREFDSSLRGTPPGARSTNAPVVNNQPSYAPPPAPPSVVKTVPSVDDPLIQAAQREGIDTTGKSREQIASELSFKLNRQ
jgi:sec-independent protein translocase protein TatA